jgi:hypothetical protein
MTRASVLSFPSSEIRAFSVDPNTQELVIRLHLGDCLPHHVAEVLNALSGLVGTLRRTQEFCQRQADTDERIEAQRRRHIEVARTYQRLRLAGVKHRAAINSLFIDPSFSDLHASTAEISYWVKAYCLSPSGVGPAGAGRKAKATRATKS